MEAARDAGPGGSAFCSEAKVCAAPAVRVSGCELPPPGPAPADEKDGKASPKKSLTSGKSKSSGTKK